MVKIMIGSQEERWGERKEIGQPDQDPRAHSKLLVLWTIPKLLGPKL